MKVTINKKGQITIPWLLRQALWSRPGDELQITLQSVGTLEIENPTPHYEPALADLEAVHRAKYAKKYGLPSPAVDPPQKKAVQKLDS